MAHCSPHTCVVFTEKPSNYISERWFTPFHNKLTPWKLLFSLVFQLSPPVIVLITWLPFLLSYHTIPITMCFYSHGEVFMESSNTAFKPKKLELKGMGPEEQHDPSSRTSGAWQSPMCWRSLCPPSHLWHKEQPTCSLWAPELNESMYFLLLTLTLNIHLWNTQMC